MNRRAAGPTRGKGRAASVGLLAAGILVAAGVAGAAEVRYVGAFADGPAAPSSLVVEADVIASLEPYSRQVTVFTAGGVLQSRVDISGSARGLARLRGNVFVFCDRDRSQVTAVDLDTGAQTLFLSLAGEPGDVVVSGSECFVLDSTNRRIVCCDLAGTPVGTVALNLPGTGGWPADLAWDAVREIFYVFEQTQSRVHAFGRDGEYLGAFCSFGGGAGEISRGGAVVCDADGWIYVTDRYQGRVAVFDPAWNFVVNVDPVPLGQERLKLPTGVAVDESGLVYVSALEGAAIHVFHLDKSTSAASRLLAMPVSPGAGESLPVNGLQFVAGVQAPAALAADVVVDFRLVDPAAPEVGLAEAAGLPLVGGTVVGDIVIGSVAWEPTADLEAGRTYAWQARTRAGQEAGAWMALRSFVPTVARVPFRLGPNAPNPFNPRTVIPFSLGDDSPAELTIFDMRGRQVWRRDLSAFGPGSHRIAWEGTGEDGAALPSGIYFYRLTSGSAAATRKMVLVR